MKLYEIDRGESPLIVDVPHAGTYLPVGLAARLTAAARSLPDTDWHVEKLFSFARGLGVTLLVATHSRYVVDLNRDPFTPYHAVLAGEIERVLARHGYAILLDGHSIRREVPRFFAGRLPDLNLGTADGASCAPEFHHAAALALSRATAFSNVVNGRFKGGYITRYYGVPSYGVHALQLETAQACYMNEAPPYRWDANPAAALVAVLEGLVEVLVSTRPRR
jgi:N-formylglutamate amidohydrolase